MRQRAFAEFGNRLSLRRPTNKPAANWASSEEKNRRRGRRDRTQPPPANIFLVFGDGSVQQGACSKGSPKIPLKALKRDLAARPNFKFALVKEPYTSQLCSLCSEPHRINAAYLPAAGPLREPLSTYVYDPGKCGRCRDRVAEAIAQGVAVPSGGECYVVRACPASRTHRWLHREGRQRGPQYHDHHPRPYGSPVPPSPVHQGILAG